MATRSGPAGTLALIGGGEWDEHHQALDRRLLDAAGVDEVVVLPTAAAFEHPDRVGEAATAHFAPLGAKVRVVRVLNRREAEAAEAAARVEAARFVYVADGSPMHLRSVLKGSPVYEAMLAAFRAGAVIAASGAGATVLCDPMVDPRGGAYTVGLGFVEGLAVFPYHGSAADHLRERSIELKPPEAVLVGIDEETALVRQPGPVWSVAGAGAVTVYGTDGPKAFTDGATGLELP
jgi:cyanophycinase